MKIERWTTGWTFRAKIGRLWFGANLHTPSFFIMLKGGPYFLSWNSTEMLLIKTLALATLIAVITSMW